MEDKDIAVSRLSEKGRPDPDPTLLTTQALFREVATLKELIEQRIKSSEDRIFEKFNTVETEFELLERQRVEQKSDTKDAVDSALAAAKEAVKEQTAASEKAITKSENSTKEILNQLSNTFNTANTAFLRSLDEMKERIAAIDTKASAIEQQKVGAKDDRSGLYAAIGIISTLVFLAIGIVAFIATK